MILYPAAVTVACCCGWHCKVTDPDLLERLFERHEKGDPGYE